MSDKSIERACYCGVIRFSLDYPLDFVSHCHCESCRKSHGSGFVTWTGVDKDKFRFTKGEGQLKRYKSSDRVTWGLCSECGTSFYYVADSSPHKVYITVANLNGPLGREPDAHVSFEEHVDWIKVDPELPRYRGKGEARM